MVVLARQDGERVAAPRISEAMNIPPQFLARVMASLVRAGLVEATTGRAGGYRLARPAASIAALEIIEAAEGDARRRDCVLRGAPCGVGAVCDAHEVFAAAQEALIGVLRAATLAELAVPAAAGDPPLASDSDPGDPTGPSGP
jgi:Rrf2 family protein